ncbi:hypothetical protein KH5_18040 [Urechidicola sp. KH5]
MTAQTQYTFSSSGSDDSAEVGYKSIVSNPVGANIIVTNNMDADIPPHLKQTGNITGVDMVFTIKGDGLNTDFFDLDNMEWRFFNAGTYDLQTDTSIEFKDFDGNTIDLWTLNTNFTMTGNSVYYNITDIFGKTEGVLGVSEMIVTIDMGSVNTAGMQIESITLNNNNVLSVTEEKSSIDFKMYPNPSNGKFNIDFKEFHKEIKLEVINSMGQLVFRQFELNTDRIQTNINSKLDGLFYIRVNADDKEIVYPMILNSNF